MSKEARPVPKGFVSYARLVGQYVKANLAMAMEYKASFVGRIIGMLVNDLMWLSFWLLYFARFPVVQGWERNDVITLWAVCAFGFGLCYALFGNVHTLSSVIMRGDLDFYLGFPRNVLVHTTVARMDETALGDVAFGLLVFLFLTKPTLTQTILFLVSGVAVAALFWGFSALCHSLSFFIGSSERLSGRLEETMLHFATYPSAIFDGATRVLIFTLIPAGFVNSVPVRIVRGFDPWFFLGLLAAASSFVALAFVVFGAGQKRYESGNLMQTRM